MAKAYKVNRADICEPRKTCREPSSVRGNLQCDELSLTPQIKSDTAPVVESSRLVALLLRKIADFHTLAFLHKLGRLTASDTRIKRD